jgi:hypothetical protein
MPTGSLGPSRLGGSKCRLWGCGFLVHAVVLHFVCYSGSGTTLPLPLGGEGEALGPSPECSLLGRPMQGSMCPAHNAGLCAWEGRKAPQLVSFIICCVPGVNNSPPILDLYILCAWSLRIYTPATNRKYPRGRLRNRQTPPGGALARTLLFVRAPASLHAPPARAR